MVQADSTNPTSYLGIEFGSGVKRAKATGNYVELCFDNEGSIATTGAKFMEEGKADGDLNEVFSKLRAMDPDGPTKCVISFDPSDDAEATNTIRDNLQAAAEAAGFDVKMVVTTPEAVVCATPVAFSNKQELALVVDVGETSTTIAIVKQLDGELDLVASKRVKSGGDALIEATLVNKMKVIIEADDDAGEVNWEEEKTGLERLMADCRRAQREMSNDTDGKISVRSVLQNGYNLGEQLIDREEHKTAIVEHLTGTFGEDKEAELYANLLQQAQAKEGEDFEYESIKTLIFAGGFSRIAEVRGYFKDTLEIEDVRELGTVGGAARGAATIARILVENG